MDKMTKGELKRIKKIVNMKIAEYIDKQGFVELETIKKFSESLGGNGVFDTNKYEIITKENNVEYIVLNIKNAIIREIVGELDTAICRKASVDRKYINRTVTKIVKKYNVEVDDKFKCRINKTLNNNYGIVNGVAVLKHGISYSSKKVNAQKPVNKIEEKIEELKKFKRQQKQQEKEKREQRWKQIQEQERKKEQEKREEQIRKQQEQQYSHVCYRFLTFAGEIIYVGRAEDLIKRMESHARSGHLSVLCYNRVEKVEFCKFDSEDDLDIAERYYISKFQPEYNVDFKNKKYFTISELDNRQWKVYEPGVRILKNK